jgi:hypothetical protein
VQLLLCFAGIIIRLKIRTKLTFAPACAVHLRNEKQMAAQKAREANGSAKSKG